MSSIFNVCEVGKLPMIESECILVGFENKTFTDDKGKDVHYADVTLSNGLQTFVVSCTADHGLNTIELGRPYLCKFFINKKRIKLIGLYDLKK